MNYIDCFLSEFYVVVNILRYMIFNFVMKGFLVIIVVVVVFVLFFNCVNCVFIFILGGNVFDGILEEKKLVSDIEFY